VRREPFKTTVLGIILFGVLSSWIANHLGLIHFGTLFGRTMIPTITATPSPTPRGEPSDSTHKDKRADLKKEQLVEQYDSLNSRFAAVEASLQQRTRDLGNLPMKPEITASIQTTRLDLAEAQGALSQGDLDRAALRLKRVEEALKYLESL
jgi:hypothetical protein